MSPMVILSSILYQDFGNKNFEFIKAFKTYQVAIKFSLPWPLMTKNKLESVGISQNNDTENSFEKLKENFHQESFEEIISEHSKLRTS